MGSLVLYKAPGSAASLSWCSAKTAGSSLFDGVQNKGDAKTLRNSEQKKSPKTFIIYSFQTKKIIMSCNSFISYRRPWESHRGYHNSSTSLLLSLAPQPGRRVLRLATSFTSTSSTSLLPDLARASSLNTELLSLRHQEREQLVGLNDRFASYVDKVRHLEAQNRALLAELEALRQRQSQPSRLRDLYESRVRTLRALVQTEGDERARVESEQERLRDTCEQLKEQYEEEQERRRRAEEELQKAREEAERATLAGGDAQAAVTSLGDELVFLRRVFAEERAELQQQLRSELEVEMQMEMGVEVGCPDLSVALRDIRAQYEQLASQKMRAADEWYRGKAAGVAEAAARSGRAVHAIREETAEYRHLLLACSSEVEALRNVVNSLSRQLEEAEETQAEEVAKYQVIRGGKGKEAKEEKKVEVGWGGLVGNEDERRGKGGVGGGGGGGLRGKGEGERQKGEDGRRLRKRWRRGKGGLGGLSSTREEKGQGKR